MGTKVGDKMITQIDRNNVTVKSTLQTNIGLRKEI